MNQQDENKKIKKAALIVMGTVLVIFAGIMLFTDIIYNYLGKSAENITLGVIAAVLIFMLYKSNKKK